MYATFLKSSMSNKQGVSKMKSVLVAIILSILLVSSTQASIYGVGVEFNDLQDQRTFSLSPDYNPDQSSGGLSGYWPYSFSISWDISYDLDALLWHYEYNLLVSTKDVSHFILEVTDSAQHDDITNIFISGNPATIESPQTWTKAGNQTLPNSFYGIKFDEGGSSVSYSFDSTLDPVWGNFYAKGGIDKGNLINAYNNALYMNNFDSNDKLDFIVRPNGGHSPPVVPEPASALLFLSGAPVFIYRRYVKKIKKTDST